MRQRDVIAAGLLYAILLVGCQGASEPVAEDKDMGRILAVVEAKVELLGGPEMMDCPKTLCGHFLASELADLIKYRDEVGALAVDKLRDGHHGAAYIAGYLGTAEAIPIMRRDLLRERYHYGWEGTDLSDEQSYLGDHQFPRHMAYVLAIEKIGGQPILEVVKLSAAERAVLEDEAGKADTKSVAGQRYLAAKWLLKKLKE